MRDFPSTNSFLRWPQWPVMGQAEEPDASCESHTWVPGTILCCSSQVMSREPVQHVGLIFDADQWGGFRMYEPGKGSGYMKSPPKIPEKG